MTRYIKRTLALAVITGAFITMTGCATMEELNDLRADLQSQIDGMKSDVAAAKSDAASANAKSNDAVNLANEANRCCIHTNEEIDRMFKKSMQK